MNLGRLNHVGVATPSIERSVALYRDLLGATKIHAPFDLPPQGVRVCFVDTPNSQIELIEPLGIPHAVNPRLVRGLDYYCHTCFEIISSDLGAQGTVMGGGRYDGLVGIMGGPETPGVGWASGVERCMMLLREEPQARRPIALVPIGDEAERQALILAGKIREAGLPADLGYSGNMSKRMKRANKIKARVAVILGETELAKNVAVLRDLDSGEQREVPLDSLVGSLAQYQ